MGREHAGDRRIRRTRGLLHQAMAALLHEKSWDDIVVKEILARADVGRSTFYTHFADKDALLLSALRETVGSTRTNDESRYSHPADPALRFSLPLLQHIERIRSDGRASRHATRYAPLHARLQSALSELITEDLRQIPHAGSRGVPTLPLDLVARHLASTFLLTLEWWIGLPTPIPAREADEVFQRLARPVLAVDAE